MKKTFSIKKIAVIAAILMASVAGIIIFIYSQRLTATTMRLLKMQGIVKLFDKEKEKTIIDNIRLASGNSIKTEAASLAAIALDDSKVVTINDESRAQFEQKGKKLNIKLTDGSLFFEVSKKLAADETFDIRTSSMVVGIRGTSGYVAVDEEGHETLYITDGEVEVIGTNPVTGEQKVIRVKAGQRIRVYLYNDRPKDSIMFTLEDVSEDDLKQAIKDRLIENDPLLAKVCNATGWDKNKILGIEMIPEDVVPTNAGDVIEEPEKEEVASAAESSSAEEVVEEAAATTASTEEVEEPQQVVEETKPAVVLPDTSEFDPAYYASQNQDVVDQYGNDPEALYQHYQEFGEDEGRAATASEAQEQNSSQEEAYLQFQQDLARAQEEQAEQQRLEQQQRLDQQAMQNALNQANNMNQDNGQDDTNYVDNNSTQVNNTQQQPNNDYNPYADPNSELYDPDNTNPDNPNYIDPDAGDPNNDPGNGNGNGNGTGGP
ncbi:MAG: FecR domain-containing protein [Butyrivibrio sp.]|uniref:FecR family protein n=1 Tax=Butyrivibrio sp. TaxID=28121 RepID=UPI0025C73821|nr:FecR family protein [Butyrivibrio sp.]MBQ6589876.1 FecR domain-containing protein [Butyrivibrio sp.]